MIRPSSEHVGHERGLRPAILVVDDDQGVQQSCRVILEDQYNVLEARDGLTALSLVESGRVDLVLLDLRLPGMDGVEVLARIKETKPQMKVIVVTAVIGVRTAVEVMKLGAIDYLTKPFSHIELLSLTERALIPHIAYASPLAQPSQTPLRRHILGECVLLVGGALGTLAALKLALERYVPADMAANATVALQRISKYTPALLLVHNSLPSADGVHLLRAMRSHLPDCPVLLISTDASHLSLSAAFASLPTYVLIENPYRFNELLHEIATILAIRRTLPAPPPSFGLHVAKSMFYIGTYYPKALTVKTLADEIGVSEGHLAHLFPAELRMTVKEFVTKVRIEVTKQLLYELSYTLEYIAERVGFSDASHLSRMFRRFIGRRPGDYRREITGS
ncbi:MAG: response regulator [Candidatus Entotheonellia bacterium]